MSIRTASAATKRYAECVGLYNPNELKKLEVVFDSALSDAEQLVKRREFKSRVAALDHLRKEGRLSPRQFDILRYQV